MIALLKSVVAFATGQWRLLAVGGAALAFALGIAVVQHERHARIAAERERDVANLRAAAAVAQAALNQTAASAATRADARAATFTVKGREAVHEVQSSPGADQRLPDAVRNAWLTGLRGMREPPGDVSAAPDHPGG